MSWTVANGTKITLFAPIKNTIKYLKNFNFLLDKYTIIVYNYTCKIVDNSSDSEVDGTEETSNEKVVDSDELSTFYIKFYNANKYFGTSSYIGNSKINDFPYRGYVRVTGKGLRRKYTLCVDDFHYGTSEITEDDLDTLEIKEGVLCQLPEDAIVCEK